MGNYSGYNHKSSPIGWLKTRAGSAVLQYADSIGYSIYATILGKRGFHTFQDKCPKVFPLNPSWFLTESIGAYRPIRIWFKIRQKMFAAEENDD